MHRPLLLILAVAAAFFIAPAHAQRDADAGGRLRIALVKQPFIPNGTSVGPTTMASGGIQDLQSVGDRFRHDTPERRRRAFDCGTQPDDRGRGQGLEGAAVVYGLITA